jgi:hypothetical protein
MLAARHSVCPGHPVLRRRSENRDRVTSCMTQIATCMLKDVMHQTTNESRTFHHVHLLDAQFSVITDQPPAYVHCIGDLIQCVVAETPGRLHHASCAAQEVRTIFIQRRDNFNEPLFGCLLVVLYAKVLVPYLVAGDRVMVLHSSDCA